MNKKLVLVGLSLLLVALMVGSGFAADEAKAGGAKTPPAAKKAPAPTPPEIKVYKDGGLLTTITFQQLAGLTKAEMDVKGKKTAVGPYLKDVLKLAGVDAAKNVKATGLKGHAAEFGWDKVTAPDQKIVIKIGEKPMSLTLLDYNQQGEHPKKEKGEKAAAKTAAPVAKKVQVSGLDRIDVMTK